MPSYNDDLIYNNATDGEVFLEAPANTEGEDGAETWRFVPDKGLYKFKKYNGQWYSRRYSPEILSAEEEVQDVTINTTEIDAQISSIYDLTVTNSINFTGSSVNIYSFSSPLSYNASNQAVSLPFTSNLKLTNGDLDTIQPITTTSEVEFKNIQVNKDNGVGGNLDIEGLLNSHDVDELIAKVNQMYSQNYTDATGNNQTTGLGLSDLTQEEVDQLQEIGSNTISNTQWSYLGTLNQPLATTNNVVFNSVNTNILSLNDDLEIGTISTNNTVPIDFANKLNLENAGYTSGFLGNGWSIYNKVNSDNTTTGKYVAEVDDLIVRGSMNVHELVINQIRATNGALIVSDAGKVADKGFQRDGTYTYIATLKFDTDVVGGVAKPAPFAVGDLILHRRVQASDNSIVVNEAKFYVSAINVDSDPTKIKVFFTDVNIIANSKGCYAKIGGTQQSYDDDEISTDWDGATFVRAGSRSDTDRQGLVLITSQDSQAPFVDVIDGVTSWEIWDGVTGNVELSNGNFDNLPSTGSLVTSGIPNWTLQTSTGSGAYLFASGGIGGGQYIGLRDGTGTSSISQDLNYTQFYEGVTYVLEFYAKKNTSNANMSILIGSADNSWNNGVGFFVNGNVYNAITGLGTFDSSWRKYKIEFTANAEVSSDTDAKVVFSSTGGNTEEVGLDSIRIYAKDKTKVRLGNLAGVGKSGYGLWGDNVFMDGRIEISEGYIGNSDNGWLLDATSITALGSNANISIPSSTGTTGYNSGGVYMSGHSTEVFSLGNTSSGNGLTWDGTNLNVSGNITIGNIGDISLSEFDNDLNISSGDYSRFHIKLNSSNGTNTLNGALWVCGFDADGNVSSTENARFMITDGTFISISPDDLGTSTYQNDVGLSKDNLGNNLPEEFRFHNDDGLGYILLDSEGDFGRTGGNARPAGSAITVNASFSQRLVYVVYNHSKGKWYYDDNVAPSRLREFKPISTDYIIAQIRLNQWVSDGAIVEGEPFFVAKQPGAIENYYENVVAGGQNVSWSYSNSAGWNLTHTHEVYQSSGNDYWHTLKKFNFPLIPDGSSSDYKVRIVYEDFPEFAANSMDLCIEYPSNYTDLATHLTAHRIGYLASVANGVQNTQEFSIDSADIVTGHPLIIHLRSNDNSDGTEGSNDTGKVYKIEIFDASSGAGLNDLFPVGDLDENNTAGLYLGSDKLGYFNPSNQMWGVKIENNGNFFFGNSSTNQTSANCVQWDGSTLEVKGLMKAGAVESSTFSAEKGTKIDLDGASMKMGGDGTSTNTGHYWFEFDTEATVSTMKWMKGNAGTTKEEIVEIGTSIANYTSPIGGADLTLTGNSDLEDEGDGSLLTNVHGIQLVGDDRHGYHNTNYPIKDAVIMMGDDWDLKYPIFGGEEIGANDGKSHLCLKSQYTPSQVMNYIIDLSFMSGGYVIEVPINRGTSGYVVKSETGDSTDGEYLSSMPYTGYLNINKDNNRFIPSGATIIASEDDDFPVGTQFSMSDAQEHAYTNMAHTNIGFAHIGDCGDIRWAKSIGFFAEVGSMETTSSAEPYANHDVAHYTTDENDNAWESDNEPAALTHVGLAVNLLGFGSGAHKNFGHEYGVYVKKTDSVNHNGGAEPAGPSYGYLEDSHTTSHGSAKKNQSSIGVYSDVSPKRGAALVTVGNVIFEESSNPNNDSYMYNELIMNYDASYGDDVRIDNNGDDRGKMMHYSSTREIKEDIQYIDLNDTQIEKFLNVKPCYFKEKQWKRWNEEDFKKRHLDMWGNGKNYEEGWVDAISQIGFIAEDFIDVDNRVINWQDKPTYNEYGERQSVYTKTKEVFDDSKWTKAEIENPNLDTGDAKEGDHKYENHTRVITKHITREDRVQEDGSYVSSPSSYKHEGLIAYHQSIIAKLWEKVKELESKIN